MDLGVVNKFIVISGQHLLSFLITTMARQSQEQRQCRLPSDHERDEERQAGGKGKDKTSGTPETGFEPPKFVRRALECCLQDWNSMRTMLLAGVEDGRRQVNVFAHVTVSSLSEWFSDYCV